MKNDKIDYKTLHEKDKHLLDQFALAALPEVMNGSMGRFGTLKELAKLTWKVAEALMEERNERRK